MSMTTSEKHYKIGAARVKEYEMLALVKSAGYKFLMSAVKDRLERAIRSMEREDDPRKFDRLVGQVQAYRVILGDPDEMTSLAVKEMDAAHQEMNRLGAGLL